MDRETWAEGAEGTGIEKEIMYAGKLLKEGHMYSIRHAQSSLYNMASKRVLWVAARSDERQANRTDAIQQFTGRNGGTHTGH